MDVIVKLAVIGCCAFVVIGAVCRLDMLHASIARYAHIAMYTLAAIFAFGVSLDILHDRIVDWWEVAGVIALGLQLHLTQGMWIAGPPAHTMREPKRGIT